MPVQEKDARGAPVTSTSPATKLVPIIPNDSLDLTDDYIRGIWVGIGGSLTVVALNDDTPITLLNVLNGSLVPVMVKKVMTATTATNLVGFR